MSNASCVHVELMSHQIEIEEHEKHIFSLIFEFNLLRSQLSSTFSTFSNVNNRRSSVFLFYCVALKSSLSLSVWVSEEPSAHMNTLKQACAF